MLSIYDYFSISCYLIYLTFVGIIFKRRNKNTSDYFRGGGTLPWWLTGASMWMTTFSAWTFTGAAGKIYEKGPYVLCLYYALIPAFICVYFLTCYRFRRMRVVTPAEAIRLRFGATSQQFYTWSRLPFILFLSAVNMNVVGVFMSAVFNLNLNIILIILGVMVTCVSLLGGSLSIVASDFVQMFLVVTLVLIISFLTLMRPEIGGVYGLIHQAPSIDFHWNEFARPEFIVMWSFCLILNNVMSYNSMDQSAKYLMAASDRDARRMVLIPLVGMVFGPLIWIIPPIATSILHPDLAHLFPNLEHPHEGAFLEAAREVLPQGMLGLLLCGIFASTLSSLDAGLNQGAGIFVRNFYLPILNPHCPENKLLKIGKICTGIFGLIIVLNSLAINYYRTTPLFEFVNQVNISLLLPLTVPLCFGIYFKRTPGWSTWSTVLIGMVVSFCINTYDKPSIVGWWFPSLLPFSAEEANIYPIIVTVVGIFTVCSSWFLFTSLFYQQASPEYRASVEEFFSRLSRPLEPETQTQTGQASQEVPLIIGKLLTSFGSMVFFMVFIPNTITGRLCFIFCGSVMAVMGWLVWSACHKKLKTQEINNAINRIS